MNNVKIRPEDYHRHTFNKARLPDLANAGYVSASLLSEVRNPIKFLSDVPRTQTGAMSWGSLVDCLWTTPELFDSTYATLPPDAPRRPTEAQKTAKNPSESSIRSVQWWEKWEKESSSKIVVPPEQLVEAQKAVKMLHMHPLAAELLAHSETQVTLMGEAPEHLGLPPGTKAKAMMDLLPTEGKWKNAIVDLKTTNFISENQMHDAMFTYDYVMKMAFYAIMAEAAGYRRRDRAILIWSGSNAPYEVVVREITDLEFGKQIVMKRVERLKSMKAGDIKPYIDTELKPLPLREWAITAYSQE